MSNDTVYIPMQWAWMGPCLVTVSVVVALATAMLAVHCCTRARIALPGSLQRTLSATGSVLLGGGIWSMHYIGMQAFIPCAASNFSILHSTLLALPSLLAASFVVNTLIQLRSHWWRMLGSGAVRCGAVRFFHNKDTHF